MVGKTAQKNRYQCDEWDCRPEERLITERVSTGATQTTNTIPPTTTTASPIQSPSPSTGFGTKSLNPNAPSFVSGSPATATATPAPSI
jgi:hypothetical protein